MIDLDQNLPQHPLRRRLMVFSVTLLLLVAGCSLMPPVQEMSNARQSLRAAKSAGAEVHDSKRFSRAKTLLQQASLKIDMGEYGEARELAIEARNIAIKARQVSLSKN